MDSRTPPGIGQKCNRTPAWGEEISGRPGLQILLIALGRKGDPAVRGKQFWSGKGGTGLMEELPNMIGHGLLFWGGEVKVCALWKEFFGDAEHQATQGCNEEGRMEWILTFWHHHHLLLALCRRGGRWWPGYYRIGQAPASHPVHTGSRFIVHILPGKRPGSGSQPASAEKSIGC